MFSIAIVLFFVVRLHSYFRSCDQDLWMLFALDDRQLAHCTCAFRIACISAYLIPQNLRGSSVSKRYRCVHFYTSAWMTSARRYTPHIHTLLILLAFFLSISLFLSHVANTPSLYRAHIFFFFFFHFLAQTDADGLEVTRNHEMTIDTCLHYLFSSPGLYRFNLCDTPFVVIVDPAR